MCHDVNEIVCEHVDHGVHVVLVIVVECKHDGLWWSVSMMVCGGVQACCLFENITSNLALSNSYFFKTLLKVLILSALVVVE